MSLEVWRDIQQSERQGSYFVRLWKRKHNELESCQIWVHRLCIGLCYCINQTSQKLLANWVSFWRMFFLCLSNICCIFVYEAVCHHLVIWYAIWLWSWAIKWMNRWELRLRFTISRASLAFCVYRWKFLSFCLFWIMLMFAHESLLWELNQSNWETLQTSETFWSKNKLEREWIRPEI